MSRKQFSEEAIENMRQAALRRQPRHFSAQAIENIREGAIRRSAILIQAPFHKGYVVTPKHRVALNEGIRTKRRKYNGTENPNFGKKHSEETRLKISQGVLATDTLERRQRMSEAAKAFDFSGSRNGNWKGDRYIYWQYPSEFNDELKDRIRERDNHTCQHCDTTHNKANDWKLDVHHRDGNRFNNNEDNLIALCRSCHKIAEAKLRAEKEVMIADVSN